MKSNMETIIDNHYEQNSESDSWRTVKDIPFTGEGDKDSYPEYKRTLSEADKGRLAKLYADVHDYINHEMRNNKEYAELMDPIVRKIDEGTVSSINDSFLLWGDYRVGYSELIDYLAYDLFKIDTPRLEVRTIPKEKRNDYPIAQYSHRTKSVRVFHSEDDSYWATGKITSPVKKIAHEMWHAYQFNQIDKGGPRSEMYQMNYYNYRQTDASSVQTILDTYYDYVEQPVEMEAHVFAEKFTSQFVKKLISSLEKECNDCLPQTGVNNNTTSNYSSEIDEDDLRLNSQMEMKVEQLKKLRKLQKKEDNNQIDICSNNYRA